MSYIAVIFNYYKHINIGFDISNMTMKTIMYGWQTYLIHQLKESSVVFSKIAIFNKTTGCVSSQWLAVYVSASGNERMYGIEMHLTRGRDKAWILATMHAR